MDRICDTLKILADKSGRHKLTELGFLFRTPSNYSEHFHDALFYTLYTSVRPSNEKNLFPIFSVSTDDRLVGLNSDGQLVTPTYHVIGKIKEITLPSLDVTDDDGWQLV